MSIKDYLWEYAIALISFKKKMDELMADLKFVRAYIDDLHVLTKDAWEII